MDGARILIVDDDPDISSAFKAILESKSYTVDLACDGSEGIEMVKTHKPDLIILDVMMTTDHEGFDVSRVLKKDDSHSHIPILMMTAVKEKTGIDFKSAAGDPAWLPVDGFIDKPVEAEDLLAEVAKLLANKG